MSLHAQGRPVRPRGPLPGRHHLPPRPPRRRQRLRGQKELYRGRAAADGRDVGRHRHPFSKA